MNKTSRWGRAAGRPLPASPRRRPARRAPCLWRLHGRRSPPEHRLVELHLLLHRTLYTPPHRAPHPAPRTLHAPSSPSPPHYGALQPTDLYSNWIPKDFSSFRKQHGDHSLLSRPVFLHLSAPLLCAGPHTPCWWRRRGPACCTELAWLSSVRRSIVRPPAAKDEGLEEEGCAGGRGLHCSAVRGLHCSAVRGLHRRHGICLYMRGIEGDGGTDMQMLWFVMLRCIRLACCR